MGKFSIISNPVSFFISNIEAGALGLPELQRPFVWEDKKARDLLKSMLNGFPIGFIILWKQDSSVRTKKVNLESGGYKEPNEVIIDGQQRLTSLYSIIKNREIFDKNYKKRKIIISYNPNNDELEVGSAAHKQSPDWIYNISDIFINDSYDVWNAYVKRKIESLERNGEIITEEYKEQLKKKISAKITNFKKTILDYDLPYLQIYNDVDEEDVANIFVNINSGGTKLNQSDFILTLVSVHYPDGRTLIEKFCSDMTKHLEDEREDICNPLFKFEPADIIRIVMALGFKRGRLVYGYKLLRGADFEKRGVIDEELRNERFKVFEQTLNKVLDRNNFKEFLKCIYKSGFAHKDLLRSRINIVYAYAFWLIGKYDFNIDISTLSKTIAKSFYFFNLTSRYSGSFESLFESELKKLDIADKTSESFIEILEEGQKFKLTDDFFNIELIGILKNTGTYSSEYNTYYAAQNILEAKVLFSNPQISTLTAYTQPLSGNRKAVESHHLFPKNYLHNLGYREVNIKDLANRALVEWSDNMKAEDKAPKDYYPEFIKNMTEDEIKNMLDLNALPDNWYEMEYLEFLDERRKLIAQIIRRGYEKLKKV